MGGKKVNVSMSTFTENEIRSYLLGGASDDLCERVENELLSSEAGLTELEIVEEELLDDYLTGDLNATEQELFQLHFLCTTERQNKLAYLRTVRVQAERAKIEPVAPHQNVVTFPQRQNVAVGAKAGIFTRMQYSTYLKLAAVILLTVPTGLFVWWYANRAGQNASLIALKRAYAKERTLETRIAGFDYAPYAPTRGANDVEAGTRILRERAERILLDAIAEKPTAANKHALGKYYVAEQRFEQAIEQFKAALTELPQNAQLENDYGVALFELSKLEERKNQGGKSMQHLAEGFEHFARALELQPTYLEALFNRALCKEKMNLTRQAIEDWQKYLELDPSSLWAVEAKRKIEQLQKIAQQQTYDAEKWYQDFLAASDVHDDDRAFQLLSESYQTTGNVIVERLTDEFLIAKEQLNEEVATHRLDRFAYASQLIKNRSGDPYFLNLVSFYREATLAQQNLLRQARTQSSEGLLQSRLGKKESSLMNFRIAQQFYHQAGLLCAEEFIKYLAGKVHLRLRNFAETSMIFLPMAQPTYPL